MLTKVPFSPQYGHSYFLFGHSVLRWFSMSFQIRRNSPTIPSSLQLLGQGTKSYWQEAMWSSKVPTVPVHSHSYYISLVNHQYLSYLKYENCRLCNKYYQVKPRNQAKVSLKHWYYTCA